MRLEAMNETFTERYTSGSLIIDKVQVREFNDH